MTSKLRWLIIGLALFTSFVMEAFFVRVTTPLAFLIVLAVYLIGWSVITTIHHSWRLRWPMLALLPMVLLSYSFLFRVDPDMWFFEAFILGIFTVLMTSFVPLVAESKAFLMVRSLPIIRHPFSILDKGIALIKNLLGFRPQFAHARQIFVGIIISIPLLFIFGALFYSADGVFKQAIDQLSWLKTITDVISWSGVWVIIRFIIWFIWLGGLWSYLVSDAYQAVPITYKVRSIPQVTVLVVVGLISALFIIFNIAQIVGLFQTGSTIMSYAESAREGFGQLVVALFLAFTLVWVVCRRHGREAWSRSIQIGVFIFLLQLIPIAFSSWHRLNLYQDAFGFTLLRLYAEWGIIASLLILPVFVLVVLGKIRYERVIHCVVFGAVCWFAVAAAIGPSYVVAKRNVDRFISGKDYSLDARYLTSLSPDSIRAWQGLQDPALRERLQLSDGQSTAQNYLVKRLTELAQSLPNYGVQVRPGEQDVLWNYHPGGHRLKVLVDQLLAVLIGMPQSLRNVNVIR